MPTYDYACRACGHEFELFQQMSAPVKRKCPECKKNRLERLVGTGAAILFKGSGFYETDYRSDSYKKAAEAEKKAAEKPAGTSDNGKGGSDKATSGEAKTTEPKKKDSGGGGTSSKSDKPAKDPKK